MTQITPLYDFVTGEGNQESSSTDGASTTCSISGASLLNGVDYLVLYCAGYGGSTTSVEGGVRIEFGSTIIARSSGEGSSSGAFDACRIGYISGLFIITGNGSDALTMKFEIDVAGTIYVSGMTLIAIPLTDLTLNTDYWKSSFHNSDSYEARSADTTWVTGHTWTINAGAGDYLVLACADGKHGGATTGGVGLRFQIDGVTQKDYFMIEGEAGSVNRRVNAFYARIHTLSAGDRILRWQVNNAQGTGYGEQSRGRIMLIKLSSFDQLVSAINDTSETIDATYENTGAEYGYETIVSKAYTPNQTEYIIIIGNVRGSGGQIYRSESTRLANISDSTYFCEQVGHDPRDITIDCTLFGLFACEQISAGKTYALQGSNEDATTTGWSAQYADIIIWSMELAGEAPSPADEIIKKFNENLNGMINNGLN